METEILEQVIISIEAWDDDLQTIGEEVRCLEETIRMKTLNNIDPTMEALLDLIVSHPNDYELGRIIRAIYIPIRILLDGKTNT